MAITSVQKTSIEEIIGAITSLAAPRGKRLLCAMFMDLVDRTEWPQYYEIIPEPRCLNNIKTGVEKGRYKDAADVYTDLSLVFWNAMFYNETQSQIAQDADTLKTLLETEWKKRTVLPIPRSSPPPSSAQKVHKTENEAPKAPATRTNPNIGQVTPATQTLAPAATPITRRTATPAVATASSSTSYNYTYTRTAPIVPRLTTTQASQDADLDNNNLHSEIDIDGLGAERDAETEVIVRHLENGLPRWPGFGPDGWADNLSSGRFLEIIQVIKGFKDVIGTRVAAALESVPEESTLPYLSYSFPHSLKLIEARARSNGYPSSKEFDVAMSQLFEKARRWYQAPTEPYGHVLLLQRLYQALTSMTSPLGSPYLSATNFASLSAGPGNPKLLLAPDGEASSPVTTTRVSLKDKTLVDELHYKGWDLKVADWVHLSNPDDPSRPIVAQVFKCWTSELPSKKGQPGITVSWYYHPEQTFHTPSRKFWEGEVFKSGHFADHPVEDILEKIACQNTARHIRGRPRPPYWYLGFPLYVCDSRYNDRERVFVKIKNWSLCLPEEVRKNADFMPIYPFERTVIPNVVASPFLEKEGKGMAIKGPGGLLGVPEQIVDIEKVEVPVTGRQRPRRNLGGDSGPKKGSNANATNTAIAATPVNAVALQSGSGTRANGTDRSVITAAGGSALLGANAQTERLPAETTKHFDRDPKTNEVLWFAAPPINVARPPAPRHSLAYLHFLASKRKREGKEDEVDAVGEGETPVSDKRRRLQGTPTVTESLRAALRLV